MLAEFGLTSDPFAIVPDGPVKNWAGRAELREDLVDLIMGVRANDIGSTEFLVLHGELGAGKSHALRYLKAEIEAPQGEFNSLAIYVERPRVAAKLNFLEIYKYIISELGKDEVIRICTRVKDKFDSIVQGFAEEVGYGDAQGEDRNPFEARAIQGIRANDRSMVQLLKRGASDEEVFGFLSGKIKCNGSEYEGKIDSDFLAAKVLSDFLRVITSDIDGGGRVYESAYLFVDECEVLFDAKATESDPVFSGFRELINGLPYGLGLVLSFSGATSLIEAYLPQHLLKRMTHDFIEIPMLEDGQAIEFLGEQLNCFRPEGWTHENEFYPFAKEVLEYVVENQTSLTPRNLFKDCRRILERAIRRHGLRPGDSITMELAEQILHYR